LDVSSQGDNVEQARDNLKEALELFFECASTNEIQERLHNEIKIGTLQSIIRQSGLPRSEFEV
jgi:predicted RNase H-like HicB family nuclease